MTTPKTRLDRILVFGGEAAVVLEVGFDIQGEVSQAILPGEVEGLLSMGGSKGVLAKLGVDAG